MDNKEEWWESGRSVLAAQLDDIYIYELWTIKVVS